MNTSELAAELDSIFGRDRQLDFDNAGYNLHINQQVKGIYVTVDATRGAIERAKEAGCNVLLTHHPITFRPLSNIDGGHVSDILRLAIRSDIAIYSAHTNVDVAEGGLNDEVCAMLGMYDVEVLDPKEGGRIGSVGRTTLIELARRVAEVFNDSHVKVICKDKEVSKVAVINGAGGGDKSAFELAAHKGADAMITSEVRYNIALECRERGFGVIETGHFESEWPFVGLAERILKKHLDNNIKIVTDTVMRSPYDEERV